MKIISWWERIDWFDVALGIAAAIVVIGFVIWVQ